MLELNDIGKRHGSKWVFRNLSFATEASEFICLLGPSGTGKSTLLQCISGALPPDSGTVRLDGVDITKVAPQDRAVATVWQSLHLFNHLSVSANVAFGLRARGIDAGVASDKAESLLQAVGLGGYGQRTISTLSGGEAQRVALVRALAVRPRVLLLDEPLGALEEHRRRELLELLLQFRLQTGAVFIMVTHRVDEALSCGGRVGLLRDGNLIGPSSPSVLLSGPPTAEAAKMLGISNVFAAGRVTLNGKTATIATPFGLIRIERWEIDRISTDSAFMCVPQDAIRIFRDGKSVPSGWNRVIAECSGVYYSGHRPQLRFLASPTGEAINVGCIGGNEHLDIGGKAFLAWPATEGFARFPQNEVSNVVD